MVADLLCAQHYFQPGEILDVCRLGELQGLQFGPIAWPVTGVSHLLTHFFFLVSTAKPPGVSAFPLRCPLPAGLKFILGLSPPSPCLLIMVEAKFYLLWSISKPKGHFPPGPGPQEGEGRAVGKTWTR